MSTKNINTARVLKELTARIRERRRSSATASYTAQLLQQDEDRLLKKIIEEAGETALAAKGVGKGVGKSGKRKQLIAELADLCYHCLVMMTRYNISAEDVAAELQSRNKQSGLAEKAARASTKSATSLKRKKVKTNLKNKKA